MLFTRNQCILTLGPGYLEALIPDVLKWLGRFEQECATNDPDHYGPVLWDKLRPLVCYLREDLAEQGRPPVHYHDLLVKAHRDIEDTLSGGMNFDGPELRRLIAMLKDKAQDIRAQSAETRAILKNRFAEDFRSSDEAERAVFIELCRSMAEECEEGLRKDMLAAISKLLDEGVGQPERLKALYELYSRLPRGAEVVADHDPSRKQPPKDRDIVEEIAKRGGQLKKVDQGGDVIVEWSQWVWSELESGNFFGLFGS